MKFHLRWQARLGDAVCMRKSIYSAVALVALAGCALVGQQAVAVFHNFKPFSPGLLRQTSQGYREGKPFGQPVTDTHCGGFTSVQAANNIKQMQAGIAPNCSMKVVADTSTLAESVQTCDAGAQQTVIRSTQKRVDERTISINTVMSKGGQQFTEIRSTLSYEGACPAGMEAPAVPKASAEDCAALPEMREQAKTASSCHASNLPPEYVARCEASMKMLQGQMAQMEAMCKK